MKRNELQNAIPRLPNLQRMLQAHHLESASWDFFPHNGFSGAVLARLRTADRRCFVLKVTCMSWDWIMEATNDTAGREAALASLPSTPCPSKVSSPSIAAAQDGPIFAILMHDVSDYLLKNEPLDRDRLDVVLSSIAAFHAAASDATDWPIHWCSVTKRLFLLSARTSVIATRHGASIGDIVCRGWKLFPKYATRSAYELLRDLSRDIRPLVLALANLPQTTLHGDLKFANLGIDHENRLCLIDWAMALRASVSVELGWFLASNSTLFPLSLDQVLEQYYSYTNLSIADRDATNALAAVCGLLLRGWRKALDADEGRPEEIRWWCERVEEAEKFFTSDSSRDFYLEADPNFMSALAE